MSSIAPLPTDWCDAVISILKRGDYNECRWYPRARQDWAQMGMSHQAYELLINTLSKPVWGEQIYMTFQLPNSPKGEAQQTYAFLCPHPFNAEIQLYAKIGLYDGQVFLDIFSLHNDNTKELIKKIAAEKKRHKAAKKKLMAAEKKARKHGH
jgi:hypothetical protein